MAEGFHLHVVWSLIFTVFINLLVATGIWFGVSIWLTIFFISRKPLKVDLSKATIERFRGLTMLAMWFSLFYFLSLTIGLVVSFAWNPTVSIFEIIISPFLLLIAIGVISVLFPFYNIHRTLLNFKQLELFKIEEEFEMLQKQLDEVLAKNPKSSQKMIALMGRLSSLQIKERKIKAAPEWPMEKIIFTYPFFYYF